MVFHVVPQIGRMGHQFVDGAVSFEPGMVFRYAGASYQRGGSFVSGSGIDFHIRKFLCVVMLFARAVALYPVVLRLQFRIGKIQHHDPPVHADAAVMLPDLLCDFPSARRAVRCEHYQTARLRQNLAGHKTQCFGRCVRQQDGKKTARAAAVHPWLRPAQTAPSCNVCERFCSRIPFFRPIRCRISALYSVRSRPVILLFMNTLRTIPYMNGEWMPCPRQ